MWNKGKNYAPTRKQSAPVPPLEESFPRCDARGGGGGGETRGVRHTGVCRSNRSLFWEKSLNIGYGFELENLKHTPHFCNFAV